ncbi:flagellar assembly protein FliW [Paenibacillus alba]|uniref:Flagellar assembly factor FliW n=1 Tax=Paenibacillus alba TaxID=1197127 RepID=A0ABU6G2S4_9BACL|nr:flagellar assembly protein FliW [Paenibacillus alba]MEC0227890.1 flagellar assembly protein FliW [Paenibacillus alba]
MLQILHGCTYQLQGSILGFEELNNFNIQVVEENDTFAYLQSLEDENISFLVTSPFSFKEDYAFELEDGIKTMLQIEKEEDVAVVTIVTISEIFTNSTVNLLAPVVINTKTMTGRQIVLPPQTIYKTNEPLFTPGSIESGE